MGFSDPAPVDALIQRFGRVNRRKEPDGLPLKGICDVYVFTKGSDADRLSMTRLWSGIRSGFADLPDKGSPAVTPLFNDK